MSHYLPKWKGNSKNCWLKENVKTEKIEKPLLGKDVDENVVLYDEDL